MQYSDDHLLVNFLFMHTACAATEFVELSGAVDYIIGWII